MVNIRIPTQDKQRRNMFLLIEFFTFIVIVSGLNGCAWLPSWLHTDEDNTMTTPTYCLNQDIPALNMVETRCEFAQCQQYFDQGADYYFQRPSTALDTTQFQQAIRYFELAARCKHCQYQDKSLFSLANSLFYRQDFVGALQSYRLLAERFPHSNFAPYAIQEAQLLSICFCDPKMNSYRQAELFARQEQYSSARDYYLQVLQSDCVALRNIAAQRLAELPKIP